jgi:DNA-binding Lrp family transcriptional regulator
MAGHAGAVVVFGLEVDLACHVRIRYAPPKLGRTAAMMTAIFVFIKCELGHANDVAADMVDNVEHVSEVYSTSGQYDLLAKFQLPKDMDIGTFVTRSVQTRPNIRDSFTVITFSPFLPSRG